MEQEQGEKKASSEAHSLLIKDPKQAQTRLSFTPWTVASIIVDKEREREMDR